MPKIDLQQIGLTDSTSVLINANSSTIETESDNLLSRTGESPNEMLADLDMNSNHILNLAAPVSATEPLRLQDLSSFLGTGTISTGAPANLSYVTLATSPLLTSERVATQGTGMSFTDGGAGGNLTIALDTTNVRNKLHPAVTVDKTVARYSGTGGDIQASGLTIDDSNNLSGVNFFDVAEIAAPASPSADHIRIYAKDVAAVTHLFTKNSAGLETDMSVAFSGILSGVFNVKDYGAIGNGVIDDATAINAAITACQTAGGGTVWFPNASYKVNSTITVNSSNAIHLMGASVLSSLLFTNTDTKLLLVQGTGRHTVENLQLLGNGIQGGTAIGMSGNSHTLHIANNCVDVKVSRCLIAGGFRGVFNEGVDTVLADIICYNTYGDALVMCNNIAPWLRRCKIDNPWPISVPAFGASFAARANLTVYAVGDVRSLAGYYIQCKTSGTSAAAPPTLLNLNTDINDGSVVWRLCCATNSCALALTTGCSEAHITQSDFTGMAGRAAISINNDLAGTGPFLTTITDCVISQAVGSCIDVISGTSLMVSGNEITPGLATGSAGIALRSSWTGDATIVNNIFFGSTVCTGLYVGSGKNHSITGNCFFGHQFGIQFDTSTTHFTVTANNCGSSTKWGTNTTAISVTATACDRYIIANNIVNGAGTGVSDLGTGVNKTITGNQ